MITISKIEVIGDFRYLWLKSVFDVDLSVHCAKCLVGKYDNRINSRLKTAVNIILTDKVYYLCGVSKPYVWSNNFHIAFREKQGSNFYIDRNGIKLFVNNAEEIEFSENDVDFDLPQAKKKEFFTCRNWQFANKLCRNETNLIKAIDNGAKP